MKILQTFESFSFNLNGNEGNIQYALIHTNTYNGDEDTILTSSNLDAVLEEFLREFGKFIKNEWNTPKSYFQEVLGKLGREIGSLTSWDSFFNLVDSYPGINKNNYLPNGLAYEESFHIEVRDKEKGYQVISEIECLKKIYDLDKNALDTYLKFY